MANPIVGNPQYDDEFEELVTVFDFVEWLFATGRGLALNLAGKETKPLHEWIEIFLLWSEYSDYKERHKYTNLQPLEAKANIVKGDKYSE